MRKAERGRNYHHIPVFLAIVCFLTLAYAAYDHSKDGGHDPPIWGRMAVVWFGFALMLVAGFVAERRAQPQDYGMAVSIAFMGFTAAIILVLVFAVVFADELIPGLSGNSKDGLVFAGLSAGLAQIGITGIFSRNLDASIWGRAGRVITFSLGIVLVPTVFLVSIALIDWGFTS